MSVSILLVDDSINFTMSTKEYLGAQGIEIKNVISKASDAYKEVENNFYDIIIIDMNLEGNIYAGLDIIKSIKNKEDVGIIVVSAHRETNLMLGALNYGVSRYLTKPFDISILHAHILDLIKSKKPKLLEKQGEGVLSTQQELILKKLSQGFKSNLIAREMGITIDTIKYHKKIILKNLDALTINEAISIATRRGLIT